MKLSKFLLICGLLVGGAAPITLAVKGQQKEMNVAKADTVTKDLATIISPGNVNFSTSYIDNFFFDFNTSEQIFTRTSYFNDHIDEFLDENGQPIDLGNGIIINGQTFNYWRGFVPDPLSYPRNSGVVAFPLYAGNVFNPVAIEYNGTALAFKVNLNYFPMDSIVVTFKAGVFKGYNNGVKYELSEDLTFYSTLNDEVTTSNSKKIKFVKARNEVVINPVILNDEDRGEGTSEAGGLYHTHVLKTNMPHDTTYAPDSFPATHYRFVYDNYLLNGVSLTAHNAWARGNSKDFTDLSDPTSQTVEYSTGKPGGAVSVNENLALYIYYSGSATNYDATILVPNQFLVDKSYEELEFTIRDGSTWYTKDEDGNSIIGRADYTLFNSYISDASDELDNYIDFSKYTEEQQVEIEEIIDNAKEEMKVALTQLGLEKIVDATKATIDEIKTPAQQHVEAVVALVDAIPDEITYSSECGAAIRAAIEAYGTLTAEEIEMFPEDKLEILFAAQEEFNALDLANYKAISILEIHALANPNDYNEIEKAAVLDLLDLTEEAIDEANTKAEVEQAVALFKETLANIPTSAEMAARELETAKANGKAELDAIDLTGLSPEHLEQAEELIANGKIAIEQCLTAEEIETLVNKIKTIIASFKEGAADAEQGSSLAKPEHTKTIIVASVIGGSLILIVGLGLAIFFIRRRKLNH